MIRFRLGSIPVAIQPFFWLTSLFVSGGLTAADRDDWIRALACLPLVPISILAHELGHAWAGRHFGAQPYIALHGLGGATAFPGARFTRARSIAVTAAGPLASLALGTVLWLVDRAFPPTSALATDLLRFGLFINFGWTVINLLPIQPMDGGQILRDALGPARFTWTCWIGAAVGAAVAWVAFSNGLIFLAVLVGFMAWQNLSAARQTSTPGF